MTYIHLVLYYRLEVLRSLYDMMYIVMIIYVVLYIWRTYIHKILYKYQYTMINIIVLIYNVAIASKQYRELYII